MPNCGAVRDDIGKIIEGRQWSEQCMLQYIILKDGIMEFNSCNTTSKQGVYLTTHFLGIIWTNEFHEINEGIITLIIGKKIYCPY